jgi:hypothetical protein
MPREARQALLGAALFTAIVLTIEFQGFLYPEAFARWRASRVMQGHCKQWHLDSELLVGPTRDESPAGTWMFRWTYTGHPNAVMLVALRWDGSSDLDGEQTEPDWMNRPNQALQPTTGGSDD